MRVRHSLRESRSDDIRRKTEKSTNPLRRTDDVQRGQIVGVAWAPGYTVFCPTGLDASPEVGEVSEGRNLEDELSFRLMNHDPAYPSSVAISAQGLGVEVRGISFPTLNHP